MAPSSKFKQSSMDSFLNRHHHTEPRPAPASDYEQIRRDTIRRNQEFLHKLGIAVTPKAHPTSSVTHKAYPASSRRPKPPPASPVPLRRSSRNKPSTPCSAATAAAAEDPALEPPEPTFMDSSVFHYVCVDTEFPLPARIPLAAVSSSSSPISGFRVVGEVFRDPSLTKIYSIDVCSPKKGRFLVAAGGHGGFISIYGGEWDDCGENYEASMMNAPLMSWKGSRSWVSGVKFMEENPMLLITSSNDGAIFVWDVTKEPASSWDWAPPVVAKSTGLHLGGVYSMDRLGCWIATASKDSSVGVSRLTPAGELVAERNITGHHSGVIRGVCFGDGKERLADCGADGRICLLDTRLPEPCSLTIQSMHSTGVNTVEWNRSNNFLILSASKDPILHLYDIRSSAAPVHSQLKGHVESNTGTCYHIYKPCFVGEKTIATPGEGSRKISLYDVDKQMLISQGVIGYDANLVMFSDGEVSKEHPRLWAAGRQISQLCLIDATIDNELH